MDEKTALNVKGLVFSYGETTVLKDISINVPKGKLVSLIGPNGSGKTTLFNIICGSCKPDRGIVSYEGCDVHKIPIRKRAATFAVIHQHEETSFPFSCSEYVILGLHPFRSRFEKLQTDSIKEVKRVMELTDTYEFADKPITKLSGGEKQRLTLARALLQRPKVLFMDEAMCDLDISYKIKIIKILKNLIMEKEITVFEINHDINTAYQFSDYVIALKYGKVMAQGSPRQIMTEEFFKDVFEVKAEVVENKGFFINGNL